MTSVSGDLSSTGNLGDSVLSEATDQLELTSENDSEGSLLDSLPPSSLDVHSHSAGQAEDSDLLSRVSGGPASV